MNNLCKKVKVYIIHVKGNNERKKYIEKQLKKIDFEYEYILEGNVEDLNKELLNKYFVGEMNKIQPKTSCAIKHLKAYQRIIADNISYGLVLEDDIKLFDNFNNLFKSSINEAKNKRLSNILISYEDSNLRYVKRSEKEKNKLLYSKEKGRLAGAYAIDKLAATNMINYIKKNKYDKPIDWFHIDCSKENIINIYWIDPPIARQGSLSGNFSSMLTEKRTNNLRRKIDFNLQRIYKKILYFLR